MGQQLSEVTATLPLGICGFDQWVWAGQAGAVWECWKLAPCCGSPDFFGVMCCLVHWICCIPCAACKLYASSLDEPCSCWPHCFCILCLPLGRLFIRYNLRKRNGSRGNIIGDCCCVCLCLAPCAFCQELRSVGPGAWRLVPEIPQLALISPSQRFLR
ncbi:hypothetical protein DQ04_01061000 [Trypanosoma grayi]|uniref:hypothetical protein n=1 Tax=Trypanosoma grayi TaxID=71804 RepID=UPI0004F48535|nr:hypothetical protein DQ04_01061000 [Trypanosoma grayi]KEG13332.1 hypothetical protein DQ04_01061000 [Trypanosoma grayi]